MTDPATSTDTKPKSDKRPETRIRDAVRIAVALVPADRPKTLGLLEINGPAAVADREYAAAKQRADAILATARRVRDFAREIEHLSAVERAMVRAGVEALSAPAPARAVPPTA